MPVDVGSRKATGSRRRVWRWLRKLLLFSAVAAVVPILLLFAFVGRVERWPSAAVGFVVDHFIRGPATTWWGPLVRTAAVRGSFAYIGLGTQMGVVDMSDPSRPRLTKVFHIGGIAHGFCQKGSTLFLAAGTGGLTVFDISDPGDPVILDRYRNFAYGMHCAVTGDQLLFSHEMDGWSLFDIRDPSRLTKTAVVEGGWVSAATIRGTLAYVLDGGRGLEVFDLSDPGHPRRVGGLALHLPPTFYDPDPPPIWMEILGDYGYIANGSDGLRIVDLTDPKTPQLLSHLPFDGFTYSVAVRDERAYVANINLGLLVVDIRDPRRPTVLNVCETPGGAYDVVLDGDRGYISDGAKGFLIADLRNPDRPMALGYLRTPSATLAVEKYDDTLVACNGSAGVDFYDVSGDGRPRLLSHVENKGLAADAAIKDSHVLIADVLAGAMVLDLNDRTRPRNLATIIPRDHPWGVSRDGEYAYAAHGHTGASVLQWTDAVPHPVYTDYSEASDGGWGYLIRTLKLGRTLLVSDLIHGLYVYDVSDPRQPRRSSTYPPLDAISSLRRGMLMRPVIEVAGQGTTAYLAAYDRGLEIVDTSDPAELRKLGQLHLGGYAYGIAHRDGMVAVALHDGRVVLVDVTIPESPRERQTWNLDGEPQSAALTERYIYVAAGSAGMAAINRQTGETSYHRAVEGDLDLLRCRDPGAPIPEDQPRLLQGETVLPMVEGGKTVDRSNHPCPPCPTPDAGASD